MKDSGIEWVGEIPQGWEIRTLKSVASVNNDVLNENLAADLIIKYVDIGSVSSDKGIEVTQMMEFGNAPSRARRLVRHGDIIISTVRTYLRAIAPIIQPPSNLVVSTGFAVIRPRKNIVFTFIKYSLQDEVFMGEVAARSTGVSYPAINANELMAIQVVIPPIPEQRAIADYLDQQTALIDQRLGTLEAKKTVLAELRKATIHEAVTKGLIKNAPMKDSGVAWIRNMPAHWQLARLAALFREAADAGCDGLPILTVSIHSGISDKELDDEEMDRKVNRSEDRTLYKRVKPGDLVYNQMRAWQGAFGAAKIEGLVSPAYIVARPKQAVVPRFVEYLLRSPAAMNEIRQRSRGITDFRLRLYWDEFKNIHLALPSLTEQLAIANYLDQQTQHIDTQLATLDEQAQVLKELRKAIIHEAVTGKIELPSPAGGRRAGDEGR